MHVHSPRPGADNPSVTKFWRQQKAQITLTICCKLQNDLFEFWFYTYFLIILNMYIAPGQGQTNPWIKILMSTESSYHFDHLLQVSKWSLWILILYTFFNYFIHVYSPEARADKSLGSKSRCQQKALTISTICCKFKKISLKSVFLHIFACFYTFI